MSTHTDPLRTFLSKIPGVRHLAAAETPLQFLRFVLVALFALQVAEVWRGYAEQDFVSSLWVFVPLIGLLIYLKTRAK